MFSFEFYCINIVIQNSKLHQSPGTKILKCLRINKNKKKIFENKTGSKCNKTFNITSERI